LLDLVGEVVGNVRLLGEFAARARGAMTAARRRVRFIVGRGLGGGGGGFGGGENRRDGL
jgi:hypothetical protein